MKFLILPLIIFVMLLSISEKATASDIITVMKSPYCGCCNAWGDHLRENGFKVVEKDIMEMDVVKQYLGIPEKLASCHTAMVDGYIIEGHVPASDIQKLLKEQPKALGLSVPRMPIGSPGMEQGDQKDPYDVILFSQDGTEVFSSHNK